MYDHPSHDTDENFQKKKKMREKKNERKKKLSEHAEKIDMSRKVICAGSASECSRAKTFGRYRQRTGNRVPNGLNRFA